jgi:hypothetical protein
MTLDIDHLLTELTLEEKASLTSGPSRSTGAVYQKPDPRVSDALPQEPPKRSRSGSISLRTASGPFPRADGPSRRATS